MSDFSDTKIVFSKRGLPCLWECGGGMTNTGEAVIIANSVGLPKNAIYVPRGGQLSCGAHALIPVQTGDIFVIASQHRGDFTINIFRIGDLPKGKSPEIPGIYYGEDFESFKIGGWSNGEEDPAELIGDLSPVEFYRAAVEAAQAKAMCYHCRSPHFIRED